MTEQQWLASEDPVAMLKQLWEPLSPNVRRLGAVAEQRVSGRKLRLFACACCRQVWHLLTDPRSRNAVEVAEQFADGESSEQEMTFAVAFLGDNLQPTDLGEFVAWYVSRRAPVPDTHGVFPRDWPSAATQAALLRCVAGNPFRPVTLPKVRKKVAIGPFFIDAGMVDEGFSDETYCTWLTPQVLALVQAAYDERPGRECLRCVSRLQRAARLASLPSPIDRKRIEALAEEMRRCEACGGIGRIIDGTLDPLTLAALADALEEAGCVAACPTCGGSGTISQDHPWGNTFATETLGCHHCEGEKYVPHPVVEHLRSSGPHVRGCWALDLILGKT